MWFLRAEADVCQTFNLSDVREVFLLLFRRFLLSWDTKVSLRQDLRSVCYLQQAAVNHTPKQTYELNLKDPVWV